MFCVIYEFELKEKDEKEFKEIWHNLTLMIKKNNGGLGSRLHKDITRKNVWIAYAQWPNKDKWTKSAPLNAINQVALTTQLKEICSDIRTVYQLEVVDDLLTS